MRRAAAAFSLLRAGAFLIACASAAAPGAQGLGELLDGPLPTSTEILEPVETPVHLPTATLPVPLPTPPPETTSSPTPVPAASPSPAPPPTTGATPGAPPATSKPAPAPQPAPTPPAPAAGNGSGAEAKGVWIDTDGDGILDTWKATAGAPADGHPATDPTDNHTTGGDNATADTPAPGLLAAAGGIVAALGWAARQGRRF